MIHFLPEAANEAAPPAAARIEGLTRALSVASRIGGEAATGEPIGLAAACMEVAGSHLELLDAWSDRAASASAAGLEAIAALKDHGSEANPAAARLLADSIRDQLDRMGAMLSL